MTDLESALTAALAGAERTIDALKAELKIARARQRPEGWANDPEIAPLKAELARLRTRLEQQERELSNARIARDASALALHVLQKGTR